MKAAPSKARRVILPSQRVVRVTIDPKGARREIAERSLFREALAVIGSDRMRIEDPKSGRLEPAKIEALPISDFHVLRDLAVRERLVAGEVEDFPCENCEAPLRFDPASLPAEDLEDRYEDDAIPSELRLPLAEPLALGRRRYTHVRARAVDVRTARPLWRQLGKKGGEGFEVTPKLLASMGIAALEGDEGALLDDPRALARALAGAPDEVWSGVEEAFLALAYPSRAITSLTCVRCETICELEVPWPRELTPGQYERSPAPRAAFPDPVAFEKRARALADETWRKMDAGGLVLEIELGVPEVDSGGVPMLGSYAPEPDEGGTRFVVRIYYRTFEREHRESAGFDWDAELAETIEHEAQHHLYYLSGHDPMDAEERAESERELVRRVGGEKRYRKLQQRAVLDGVWEIVRVLLPALALIALGVVVLSRCAS